MLSFDQCEQRLGVASLQTSARPQERCRFLVQIRREVIGALYWVSLDESWHRDEGTYYTQHAAETIALVLGARVVPVVCLPEAR